MRAVADDRNLERKSATQICVDEAVLNRVSGSRAGVNGVYQRHSWREEMRTAACCMGKVYRAVCGDAPSNLVPLSVVA